MSDPNEQKMDNSWKCEKFTELYFGFCKLTKKNQEICQDWELIEGFRDGLMVEMINLDTLSDHQTFHNLYK